MDSKDYTLFNSKKLKRELIFSSLFIMTYENFVSSWKQRLYDFHTEFAVMDGKIISGFFEKKYNSKNLNDVEYIISKKKKQEFEKQVFRRIRKEDGNYDKDLSMFDWLRDNGFIDKTDYDNLVEIRDRRNQFAHEMVNIVFDVFPKDSGKLFENLIKIRKKASENWIREIEIPIAGDVYANEKGEFTEPKDVQSMQDIFFDVIIENAMKENKQDD